ncbi:MAG: hypothetical protein LBD07_05210 [Spirochaetaceae bacterium]|jgi:hypothetical protein|nr:hypothetical protein [Spirochaetaceae bacterium]
MSIENFFLKLTTNWPAKILAIVLAYFLNIFQQMNGITSVRFDISLNCKENNEFISTTVIPSKVRLTVSGIDGNLNTITENDLIAVVDLTVYNKPGDYTIPIEIKSTENAQNINMLDINVSPGELKISLDKREGKYFPVEPVVKGDVAPGFELVYKSISPKQIYIEGPAGLLGNIKTISTESIDITGHDNSFTKNVRISNMDPSISANENTVQFSAIIKSIELSYDFNDVPLHIANLAGDLSVLPLMVTGILRIQGNSAEIQDYKPEDNAMYIDCTQVKTAGVYNIPVSLNIPDKFILQGYKPETVSISVKDVIK